jgi:hypothetical protein
MTAEQLRHKVSQEKATHLLMPYWRERGFYTTNQILKGVDIQDFFHNCKVIVTDEVHDIEILKII